MSKTILVANNEDDWKGKKDIFKAWEREFSYGENESCKIGIEKYESEDKPIRYHISKMQGRGDVEGIEALIATRDMINDVLKSEGIE